MTEHPKRQKQAKILRIFRKVHRLTGAFLFVFFFIVAISGLLLGWKKHSGDLLLARSYQGSSSDLSRWLSIDSLHRRAQELLRDSVSADLSTEVDRIDIRKEKGMVKFLFVGSFIALQLDGVTGNLLYIEHRRADFIEKIHDGSIVDETADTGNGLFKLFYTSIMGLALLVFTITGFWLWYGPKQMRRNSK